MTNASVKIRDDAAAKYATVEQSAAYENGFARGYNCASWQDLPEIGSKIWTESDGKVTVDEDNQWDVVQDLAFQSESNDRDYSPFEFTAHEFNSPDDSEELWEAFDSGIADGISANIADRQKALAA